MERLALGFCRVTAAEFEAMTPREVDWRITADTERENREFERLAQLACWVINPWMGRQHQLTVGKLLRRRMPQQTETDWNEWLKD